MLLGQFEIHPSTKLEGFGHLTPSPGGIHIPSPERHRGEQASSQNWAEHFPSNGAPTGNLRLLHQKTPTDHFPEAFSLYFPVSHSPPGPVIFICISSVWGKIQKIRTLTNSFRGRMKRLFWPQGEVVCSRLEAGHYNYHGIKLKD